MGDAVLVECPFCDDGDKAFDLIGLKTHFEKGYCDVYNNTISWEQEMTNRMKARQKDSNG